MSKTKASIAGSALAHARARKLTPERRAEIAREAGKASGVARKVKAPVVEEKQ